MPNRDTIKFQSKAILREQEENMFSRYGSQQHNLGRSWAYSGLC